jgi:hypothetical protein
MNFFNNLDQGVPVVAVQEREGDWETEGGGPR